MVHTPTVEKASLGTLSQLGVGGQGIVYLAPAARMANGAQAVYKEYLPAVRPNIRFDVLEEMTAFHGALSDADGARLTSAAAWPVQLVTEAGQPCGFLMPAISEEFRVEQVLPSGKHADVEAELQHLLNPEEVLVKRGTTVTLADRYQVLRETAELLLWLHGEGIAVGDLSAKNILYSVTPYPRTFLIDCDSMAFHGASVGTQVETPGWDVRAVSQEPLATPSTDAYKFGLVALRLLIGDQFTRDPMRLPAFVPGDIRDLIARSISPRPDLRPGLHEWVRPLATAARETSMQQPAAAAPVGAAPSPVPAAGMPPATASRQASAAFRQSSQSSAIPAASNRQPPSPNGRLRLALTGLALVGGLAIVIALAASALGGTGDDDEGIVEAATLTPSPAPTRTGGGSGTSTAVTPSTPSPTPSPTVPPKVEQVTGAAAVTYGLPYSGKAGMGAIRVNTAGPRGAIEGVYFRVYVQRPDVQGNPVTGDSIASGSTDNSGRLTLEVPAGKYIVISDRDGYNWGNYTKDEGVTDIAVQSGRLSQLDISTGSITVRITTPDGPVSGQYMRFYTQKLAVDGRIVLGDGERSGSTDNTGGLTVGLTPGKYALTTDIRGYSVGDLTGDKGATNVEVLPGKDTIFDVKLGKLTVIPGKAYVRVYTRKPAAGGGFVIGQGEASGSADNTGAWSTHLTPGTYLITLDSRGPFEVTVKAGETTTTNP